MSIVRAIEVGAATAQTVIEISANAGADPDVAGLRVGVLELLRLHASEATAEPGYDDLLAAYRGWLETAVALYNTGDESKIREYMHRGAVLSAELDMAAAGVGVPVQ